MTKTDNAKWWSKWATPLTAIVAGAYEVASFFGMPPYPRSAVAEAIAFLIFAGALLKVIATQHKELETYRSPDYEFLVQPTSKLQRNDFGWDAIYWRIAVQNKSKVIANECRVVLESWTFRDNGLNADTALPIKDSDTPDIEPDDIRQFDLFIVVLRKGTEDVDRILVSAPNQPQILSQEGGFQVVLRLSGRRIETRKYRALFLIDRQRNLNITRVDKL